MQQQSIAFELVAELSGSGDSATPTWNELAGLHDQVIADLVHDRYQARRSIPVLGMLPDKEQGVQDGLEQLGKRLYGSRCNLLQ